MLVSVLLALTGTYINYRNVKSVAFIDTSYVFGNFKMTKELEKEFIEFKNKKQKELDSIYRLIESNMVSKSLSVKELEDFYVLKRNISIEEQERLKTSFDSKIWNQINGFVKDYGRLNNIDVILGANGQGSIMYGKDDMNISEAFVEFANTKYDGK